METLYASHYVFPREPKLAQYRPPVSALSSPSAKSSSSSDSQDDLLPELWLESPPSNNFSFSRPTSALPQAATSTCCQPQQKQNVASHVSFHGQVPGSVFQPNFVLDNAPQFPDYEHQDHFHSSPLLHDDSFEYAQSLLPNSLLFPLAGGHMDAEPVPVSAPAPALAPASVPASVPASAPAPVPATADNVVRTGHEACAAAKNPKPVQQRRGSSVSSGKSKHASPSSGCSSGCLKGQCKNVNTQLYKTELCASFMKSGACPYGGKCQFAHGEAELKSVDRPSNWRSKPCANWARNGSCRYGRRCCFKHGE